MNEVNVQYVVDNWESTFCLYDPTDDECPYGCVGADQTGLLYYYGAEQGEDMDWKNYNPKATDRFFIIKEEMKGTVCQLH